MTAIQRIAIADLKRSAKYMAHDIHFCYILLSLYPQDLHVIE